MLFTSKRQSNNVIQHWYVPMDKFQFSSQDFYAEVEKELVARRVPGLTISQIDFHEGGLLSDKRVYMRLARERLAMEICAAPFGRTFFFSLRVVEKPRLSWLVILFFLWASITLYFTYHQAPGVTLTIAGLIAVGALLFWMFRPQPVTTTSNANADAKGPAKPRELPPFSAMLLDLPIIGPLYERIRKDTYYRHDTRVMFLTVVNDIVKMKVEEVTAAKGEKLIRSHEYNPILGRLYKTRTTNLEDRNPDDWRHGDQN
jgi:hypothetical protein